MRYLTLLALLLLSGCPEDTNPDREGPDADRADVARPDGAPTDGARPDAARPDAARPDAAPVDAAPVDAARPDAARPDAASVDAAQPDAARPDAAQADAAQADAAQADASQADAAQADATQADARVVDEGIADAAPIDAGAPLDPLGPRPAEQTCRLPEAPPLGNYLMERAFPALSFERPLWIGVAPGDPGTLYVVEQGGAIRAFDDRQDVRANEVQTFLRLAVSRAGNEEGLLGLAFHPGYAQNGRFFVYYSAAGAACAGQARCSVVSELRRRGAREADPASERVVMRFAQPFSNHNGGDLHFGPDGYLYISVGDGGSGGDPQGHGQNTSTLLGSILRIDVDDPPAAQVDGVNIRAYRTPADNPFAAGGGRPEIYTWGMRNVWRMSFDASTGVLWAGDVGQNAWEEVDRITGPGNYGWNLLEGNHCYNRRECPCPGCVAPIWEYSHAEGASITGGLVYRGPRLPELWGRYLFGDFVSGRLWALEERPGQAARVTQITTAESPSAFGTDAAGRVYVTSFGRNSIQRLARRADPGGEPTPRLLSDTGCFTDTARFEVAPSVVPYDLNVPFWSDNAVKARHIALPAGAQVDLPAVGPADYPVGTVFLKTFFLDGGGDAQPRRLETRMLARQAQGWRGFTWKWLPDESDAELLEGPLDEVVRGPAGPQTWHYPGGAECDRCHTAAAGYALGWRAGQLDRDVDYPAGRAPQLRALATAGYLTGVPAGVRPWPALDDDAAPVASRARAQLDANCAMCHQPGGPANARIDLRFETALGDTGVCAAPTQGDLGLNNPRIVLPGAPLRSVLLNRMTRRDEHGMPPLASTVVDADGTALIRQWIGGLQSCP